MRGNPSTRSIWRAGAATLLLAGGAGGAAADTLFADLGGTPGMTRLVDAATARFLADGRIKAAFDDTNIPRFKRMLADQLCQASGGGCVYKGRTMQAAHKGLHLRVRDFNALVEDLQSAMDAVGIPFGTQNRLLARLAPMEPDVVTR